MKTKNRLPLNEKTIVIFWDGVNKGPFGKGEYVTLPDIRDACEKYICDNSEEHAIFDGQFFFGGAGIRKMMENR